MPEWGELVNKTQESKSLDLTPYKTLTEIFQKMREGALQLATKGGASIPWMIDTMVTASSKPLEILIDSPKSLLFSILETYLRTPDETRYKKLENQLENNTIYRGGFLKALKQDLTWFLNSEYFTLKPYVVLCFAQARCFQQGDNVVACQDIDEKHRLAYRRLFKESFLSDPPLYLAPPHSTGLRDQILEEIPLKAMWSWINQCGTQSQFQDVFEAILTKTSDVYGVIIKLETAHDNLLWLAESIAAHPRAFPTYQMATEPERDVLPLSPLYTQVLLFYMEKNQETSEALGFPKQWIDPHSIQLESVPSYSEHRLKLLVESLIPTVDAVAIYASALTTLFQKDMGFGIPSLVKTNIFWNPGITEHHLVATKQTLAKWATSTAITHPQFKQGFNAFAQPLTNGIGATLSVWQMKWPKYGAALLTIEEVVIKSILNLAVQEFREPAYAHTALSSDMEQFLQGYGVAQTLENLYPQFIQLAQRKVAFETGVSPKADPSAPSKDVQYGNNLMVVQKPELFIKNLKEMVQEQETLSPLAKEALSFVVNHLVYLTSLSREDILDLKTTTH